MVRHIIVIKHIRKIFLFISYKKHRFNIIYIYSIIIKNHEPIGIPFSIRFVLKMYYNNNYKKQSLPKVYKLVNHSDTAGITKFWPFFQNIED